MTHTTAPIKIGHGIIWIAFNTAVLQVAGSRFRDEALLHML